MDEQRQQQIDEAARQSSDALIASYRTVSERSVTAQQLNAEMTQAFFNRVINNLHTQTEDTRQMTEQLADQQQRQGDAAQTLAQESASAYIDFVDSLYEFWQGGIQTAERGAKETE